MQESAKPVKNQTVNLTRQFLQYLIVGGMAFLVDLSALYGLTEFVSLHYLVSATIGFLLGLLLNYLLCVAWIFEYRALENAIHEFLLFALIGIIGLLLNNVLLYGFTEGLGMFYLVSKLLAAGIILVFNFSLRRHILFSETRYARWVRQSRSTEQVAS